MAIKNSEITAQIETLSAAVKKMRGSHPNNIKSLLGGRDDYTNPELSVSVDEINANYQRLTGNRKDLIPTKVKYTPQDRTDLANIAVIQLQAIAKGFDDANETQANSSSSYQARSANNSRNSSSSNGSSNTSSRSTTHHVYHYHNRYNDNFWRDMMIWDMLTGSRGNTTIINNYGNGTGPSAPTTSKKKKDDGSEVTIAGVIFACLLAGGALATAGYSAMQTLYRADEIVHAEDMLANTAKLGVTALAAWQGYMLGAMLGAAFFANPLLGAICTAIIASAAGMAFSKWAVELAHQATNTTSAIGYDPRFCLSDSQVAYYEKSLGRNADVANEALRECAIAIKNEPTNGLVFWQNPHRPLINLMRNIKSGDVAEKIVINDKVFDLTLPQKSLAQRAMFATKRSDYNPSQEKPTQAHAMPFTTKPVIATAVPCGNIEERQTMKKEGMTMNHNTETVYSVTPTAPML